MNIAEIKKCQENLADAKIELLRLKEKADEIARRIDGNYFVTDGLANELSAAIDEYKRKSAFLQTAGAELSFSLDMDSIEHIEQLFTECEKAEAVKAMVFDYFRLVTEAEDVKKVLVESQKALSEKLSDMGNSTTDAVQPYITVVEFVKDTNVSLTDDEFISIENTIGKRIARAVDRKELVFDPNVDISCFLQSTPSAVIPAADIEPPKKNGSEPVCDIGKNEKLPVVSDTKKDVSDEEQTDNFGIWEAFDGYTDGVSFSFNDTPASQLGASKFINAVKQNDDIIKSLYCIALQKVITGEEVAIPDEYFVPGKASLSYLRKEKYITDLEYRQGDSIRKFITLTSKGRAVYFKSDIVKFLRNAREGSGLVPKNALVNPSELKASDVSRFVLLYDYYANQPTHENNFIFDCGNSVCPISFACDDKEHVPAVIPAVMDKSESAEFISTIRERIQQASKPDNDGLVIIVKSNSDLEKLCISIELDDSYFEKIWFVVVPEYTVTLDHHGERKELLVFKKTTHETEKAESSELNCAVAVEPQKVVTDLPPVNDTHPILETVNDSAAKVVTDDKDDEIDQSDEPEKTTSIQVKPATDTVTKLEDDAIILEMLKCDKLYCASAYLRALARRNPKYQNTCRQFAYATNDPLENCTYSSEKLFDVFYNNEVQPNEYIVIAASLRNFFYNQSSYDYSVQQLQTMLMSTDLIKSSSSLNQVVYQLANFKAVHNKGMDVYADYRQKVQANAENVISGLRKDAKDIYSRLIEGKTTENASFRRLIETKKLIFSRDGELAYCLNIVCKDERGSCNDVRDILLSDYISDGLPVSAENIDAAKIDRVIEDAWEQAEKSLTIKKNSATLMGSRRNNLFQNIRRIAALLCDYCGAVGVNHVDNHDDALFDYQRCKNSLLGNIAEATREVYDSKIPESHVLKVTLDEIADKISGNYEHDGYRYYYLDFLRNEYVLLDENYLPILEEIELLDSMDPLNRIRMHFEAVEKSFEVRLSEIFSGADDYGTANLILRWLHQHPGEFGDISTYENDYEIASLQPVEDAENRQKAFIADLEMAQSQGQIDNTDGNYKETVLQVVDLWRSELEEARNFGFFYKLLDAFRAEIKGKAQVRAADMNASLDEYLQKNARWESDEAIAKIIGRIRERIEKQNYTAAEDLLNRLLADDADIEADILQKRYLEEFLDEYAVLSSQVSIAQKSLQQLLKIHEKNKDTRGAGRLVENWPSNNGIPKERIANLLIAMGFNVDFSTVTKLEMHNKKDQFSVRLKRPENGRKINYKHPIYVFGSEAEKEDFRVYCIYGKMDAERLTETFKDIGNAKNTIILLDYALTLPDRRKLARKVKTEYTGKTFAVIDRIVLAFLARHYSETEVNRRLMAVVMPYSAFQPYVAESSRVMPPEMFMGRRNELEKIESAAGVNIVYGGRQLGKSALLRMAQKDIDRNENGDRAILVDIKGRDYLETAKKVSEALSDEGFFLEEYITDQWSDLARAIKNRLRNEENRIPYFLLLMDEADAFIGSCEFIGYAPFDELKDIQSVGSGRFKFVVAGLRNVVRFNRNLALGNNSVLTHLSALTVKPFCYTEARELLEVPLSYLGFCFPNDEKTDSLISNICGTTNYFPGLIQLYCTKLLEAMKSDYAGYSESETPPYFVREEHIKRALADKTLTTQIKEKFYITLKVGDDDYYYLIALLGAFRYHNSGKNSFSPEDIRSTASDYGITKLDGLGTEQIDSLMKDMCELNVLQDTGTNAYRFARYSFYQMMGTLDGIEEQILNYGMSGN